MPFHLNYLLGDTRLMIVCLLNLLINMLAITTNAARVSGAETKRVATSLSLFNIFATTFRMLNLFYAPLMASIADLLSREGKIDVIYIKFQFIIFFAAIGSFIGMLMLPTFIEIYKLGIKAIERHGSIPKVAYHFMRTPGYWKSLFRSLRRPSLLGVKLTDIRVIPRSFLIFNIVGIAMWTIGVISSTYASVLNPDLVRTSLHLSGIVNGIGTILLFILVEPVSALIVDQAVSEHRPLDHVKLMVMWLGIGSIIGNLLGMLIFAPGAHYILWVSKFIGSGAP